MSRPVGSRVGAILSASLEDKTFKFLGYGVYEGDFVPHQGAAGWMTSAIRGWGHTNPRIKLDSGKVVYGCQCWWGPEEQVQKMIAEYEAAGVSVEMVTLEDEAPS